MPTGYTSNIYEGKDVTAKEFLLSCARNFGANIMLREEGFDVEIPVYEPNPYDWKAYEKANQQLEKIVQMTDEEIQKEIDQQYEEKVKANELALQKKKDLTNRYETLLADVRKWTPPTDEHNALKEFAINQLVESIEFDCKTTFYEQPIEKSSVEAYRLSEMQYYTKQMARSLELHQKEVERVNQRNAWNQQLKESLT